jgi:hypothetical protein
VSEDTIIISAADADMIKRFIEENLTRFIDWLKTNNEFPEGQIEEKAAELLDSLEG